MYKDIIEHNRQRKHIFQNLDYSLIFVVICVLFFSILMIYSATNSISQKMNFYYVQKQLFFIFSGLLVIFFLILFDYQYFEKYSYLIYFFFLFLLIWVFIGGYTSLGAKRWIKILNFRFQPSEFAKIALIFMLAKSSLDSSDNFNSFWQFAKLLFITLIPTILVLKQPDLGTSMVFMAIFFGMSFIAGVNFIYLVSLFMLGFIPMVFPLFFGKILAKSHLLHIIILFLAFAFSFYWLLKSLRLSVDKFSYIIIVLVICAGIFSSFYLWQHLKGYQKIRLLTFMNPNLDPKNTGYQLIQSKIAIGSGSFWGNGMFSGSQNTLRFIPERHTDFIFSIICEETGFLGALVLLLCYIFIIFRGWIIAQEARDRFGMLVATGIITLFTFHIIINIGMTMGIMPITGLPLIFMSYGGSSLLMACVCIGILLNIYLRRKRQIF